MSVTQLGQDIERLKKRVKKIEEQLEIVPMVNPLEWDSLTELQKKIYEYLLLKKHEGATTTEIAEALKANDPQGSGRVIIYRNLKVMDRVSKRVKGSSIVISVGRRWSLNFDEFYFPGSDKE